MYMLDLNVSLSLFEYESPLLRLLLRLSSSYRIQRIEFYSEEALGFLRYSYSFQRWFMSVTAWRLARVGNNMLFIIFRYYVERTHTHSQEIGS